MRTRPTSPTRRPRLALLLVGLCWLALAPGTVKADGCHVAEKPVLGLTLDVFDGPATHLDRPVPAPQAAPGRREFRRTPCSPNTPGPTSSTAVPESPFAHLDLTTAPATESSRLRPSERQLDLPRILPSPPERPPRP